MLLCYAEHRAQLRQRPAGESATGLDACVDARLRQQMTDARSLARGAVATGMAVDSVVYR